MQFLIETVPSDERELKDAPRWALAPTLAEARLIAADACGNREWALCELAALGSAPEGELAGTWGRVRFAPAA